MSRQANTSPIIIAMDFPDKSQALNLLDSIDPSQAQIKIGKEMFTRYGPTLINEIHQRGFKVFLDLKFHDIPNQVAGACRAAADLGVWMTNVHASGGLRMLEAAVDALQAYGDKRPMLLGVTVLTSMSQEDTQQLGWQQSPEEIVL